MRISDQYIHYLITTVQFSVLQGEIHHNSDLIKFRIIKNTFNNIQPIKLVVKYLAVINNE